MLRFSLLLFLSIFGFSYGARLPQNSNRIVGGEVADIKEAPYQVAVLQDYDENGSFIFWCGGIIINENTILSSGHCLVRLRPSQYKIRAGSTYHNVGGSTVAVSKIIQHPQFDRPTLDNDILIFKLSKNLKLGSTIATIPLPEQNSQVSDGESAFVTGWGQSSEIQIIPVFKLRKVTMPVVNQKLCADSYDKINFAAKVTDRNLCAGNFESGGVGTCYGDSGGPLAVNGTLHGITSFADGCANPRFPTVFTRVSHFVDWITENL